MQSACFASLSDEDEVTVTQHISDNLVMPSNHATLVTCWVGLYYWDVCKLCAAV